MTRKLALVDDLPLVGAECRPLKRGPFRFFISAFCRCLLRKTLSNFWQILHVSSIVCIIVVSKMLIEVDDPRTVSVMSLLQHCNSSELKELLNEDSRLEFLIRDSQLVLVVKLITFYYFVI